MDWPDGLYDLLRTRKLADELRAAGLESAATWWPQGRKEEMEDEELLRRLQNHLATQMAAFLHGEASEYKGSDSLLHRIRERMNDEGFVARLLDELLPTDSCRLLSIYRGSDNLVKHLRPDTSLEASALLTGSARTPGLVSQVMKELNTCDRADWLVSFIKMSGIAPLRGTLLHFTSTPAPDGRPRLRVATTSYMGASDAAAIEFLRSLPHTEVRISYDTRRTRLHAKAYTFHRATGFGSSYIGSANLSKAAMDQGLEWTVKVSQRENPRLWADICASFSSHWADEKEFTPYASDADATRLREALAAERQGPVDVSTGATVFYDLRPFNYQQEVLDSIANERAAGKTRHLVVAATGTGKTMISAFDFRRYLREHPGARLLFLVHRAEILHQALQSFRQVLKDASFGEVVTGKLLPDGNRAWFCTVQSWLSRYAESHAENFDYVVLDEAHHAGADSYRRLLDGLNPASLLALTATPERADGRSILEGFGGDYTHEIRLGEAIDRALVCPFHYYGIPDEPGIDFSRGDYWSRGRYRSESLQTLLDDNRSRARWVLEQVQKYVADLHRVRALGFCVSIRHAEMMAALCREHGFGAVALTAESTEAERVEAPKKLSRGEIQFIFTVDLYNEGVDLVDVDAVLFLRPTESLTVFLQQLGRGLRRAENKSHLDVFDFIAPQNENYDYEQRFYAMSGSSVAVAVQIEEQFPLAPTGCLIHLEKRAQEVILQHISARERQMKVKAFVRILSPLLSHERPRLSLVELMELCGLRSPGRLYHDTLPTVLFLQARGQGVPAALTPHVSAFARGCRSLLLQTDAHLLRRWRLLLREPSIEYEEFSRDEWSLFLSLFRAEKSPGGGSLAAMVQFLREQEGLRTDLCELLDWVLAHRGLYAQCRFEPTGCLCLHASYTRQQVLLALGRGSLESPWPSREGVFWHKESRSFVLFADIEKNERHFSETTMYEDYAQTDELFHWQSQNATAPASPTGQNFIHHAERGISVMLFIRRSKKTPEGVTAPYIFLGPLEYVSHEGSKPMSIVWRMRHAIPAHVLAWARKVER